jgi:hypothetical protein
MPLPQEQRIQGIKEFIQNHKPEGTRVINYGDEKNVKLDLYRIPVKYLIFNRYNGRINIEMASDEVETPEVKGVYDEALETKICKYLWESKISDNKITLKSLEQKGQQVAGIITEDGVIVDGNRRAMLIIKHAKMDTYLTAVLPDVYSEDSSKKIRKLETTIQMDQDKITDFNPLNKYLTVTNLKDEDGHEFNEIEKMWGNEIKKGEPEKWYNTFKIMKDYLEYLGSEGIYTLLKISDSNASKEEGFLQTQLMLKQMEKGKLNTETPMEVHKRKYKRMMFDLLRAEAVDDVKDYRLMGKGKDKSGLLNHEELFLEMFEKHNEIMLPVKDLPSLKEYKKSNPHLGIKEVALKKEEDVKKACQEKLADLFKEYTGRAKSIARGEKPELILSRILSQMKLVEKEKDLLMESENIDEIIENVRAISKLNESIKREIGL